MEAFSVTSGWKLLLMDIWYSQGHFCSTLCDYKDHIPPSSSVHGIFQAGILGWESLPPPGDLPKALLLWLLSLQMNSLPLCHLGSPMHYSVQFSSFAQSCLTHCNHINCSIPGLHVHHQLPEFTQTYVHWVSNAIQPTHPLPSSSPPAPNPSQHQSPFLWVKLSHEVAKVLEFQL